MGETAKPLKKVKLGLFANGVSGTVRYSTALRELRKTGADAAAAELERDKNIAGSNCPVHGVLHDPVIGILGDRVAFACPWCSGTDVLAAWEKEGMRS